MMGGDFGARAGGVGLGRVALVLLGVGFLAGIVAMALFRAFA